MDNQYNYYNPNQEEPDMIFDEPPKKQKKNKKASKWIMVVCMAVVFGLVGSGVFQVSNMVADKLRGISDKEVKQTTASNNSELSKTSSTVTSDVSEVVSNSMPSVVSIANMSIEEVQNFFGGTQMQESESWGSGIIVGQNDTELLIATNNHVVKGSDTLTVTFIDEQSVEANIKGTDATKDLAVLAVPLKSINGSTMDNIAVATMGDSNAVQVGEPAIAIGNALGYGQSVTTGIISATNRDIQMEGFDTKLIQTDAAINPGNSGGALLNANGEVIGINTVKVSYNAVEGMGYAIPVSDVSDVLTGLMNKETKTKVAEAEKGYLGIEGVNVTSDSSKMYDMPTGVYVSGVVQGSGAEKANLTKGVIITELNGTTVDSMTTLQNELQYYKVGDQVELKIQVSGSNGEYAEKAVTVTLGRKS